MLKRDRSDTKESLMFYEKRKKNDPPNKLYEQRKQENISGVDKQEKDKIKIIYNSYTRRRGVPQLLQIYCSRCDNYIMTYQKDGPGELLRCYLDRIHLPEDLHKRQFELFKKSEATKLECNSCEAIVGIPMVYESENRPAYRMIKGRSFLKKLLL